MVISHVNIIKVIHKAVRLSEKPVPSILHSSVNLFLHLHSHYSSRGHTDKQVVKVSAHHPHSEENGAHRSHGEGAERRKSEDEDRF